MRRLALIASALLFLVGIALLGKYVLWPERLEPKKLQHLDVDLSLSGVNLSQGKDGKKLWSLNATSANYAENKDELTLSNPVIVYLGQENEPIQVMAPKGQVWQKEDRARMWDGVNATQGTYQMRSDTLDYAGGNRTLALDTNVELISDSMHSRADALLYFLDTGDFLAQGNVQVVLQ